MDQVANTILSSGRSAVDLALFILLPIMIVMLTIMHWLDDKGLLNRIVILLTPVLQPLGLTGLSIFALMQTTMVSFAAPIATLAIMARNGSSDRHIAATLAMVMALAQANVVFPMAAAGLDVTYTIGIALCGGFLASASTYYLFGRSLSSANYCSDNQLLSQSKEHRNLLGIIRQAGKDAWDIAIGALPLLVVALVAVNLIRMTGAIDMIEGISHDLLIAAGYPPQTVLLAFTKYIAGGTAMMGIAMDAFNNGNLTSTNINLIAGLLICPLDVAGLAILVSAGPRVGAVALPAVMGAATGILLRIICHTVIYA
jgi:spore maturation protein SpmB